MADKNSTKNSIKKYIEYNQQIRVAVDMLCFVGEGDDAELLLIKREFEPFKDHWAIPGGFLLNSEELEEGAIRELKEETGIDINIDTKDCIQVGTFGKIGRDPRKRIISVAYKMQLVSKPETKPMNEALEVKWIKVSDILVGKVKLAFDHDAIIKVAIN